jgi:hypothetical protein
MTPALYRDIAMPHGIKGAIAIEASPRLEENDWVLDTIEKDTIMVGYIGDLEPDKPGYGQYLEKYHRNQAGFISSAVKQLKCNPVLVVSGPWQDDERNSAPDVICGCSMDYGITFTMEESR